MSPHSMAISPSLTRPIRDFLAVAIAASTMSPMSSWAGACSDFAFSNLPHASSPDLTHLTVALGEAQRAIPQLIDPKEPLAASWLASSLTFSRLPETRISGQVPRADQLEFHRSKLPEARIRSVHQLLSQHVDRYRHLRTELGSIEVILNATAYLAATLGDDSVNEPHFYDGLAFAAMTTADLNPSIAQKSGSTKAQINDEFSRVLRSTLLRFRFRSWDRLPRLYDFLKQDPHLLIAMALFSASKIMVVSPASLIETPPADRSPDTGRAADMTGDAA